MLTEYIIHYRVVDLDLGRSYTEWESVEAECPGDAWYDFWNFIDFMYPEDDRYEVSVTGAYSTTGEDLLYA